MGEATDRNWREGRVIAADRPRQHPHSRGTMRGTTGSSRRIRNAVASRTSRTRVVPWPPHPGGTNFNENLRPRDVIFSRRRRGSRRKIQVRSGTRLFTVLCRCLQCGCKPFHVVPVGARLEAAVEVDRHLDGRVPELFGDVGNGHCSVTGILSRCDRLTGRFLVPRLRPRLHGSDRPSVSGGWCVAGSGSFVAVQCLCWPS